METKSWHRPRHAPMRLTCSLFTALALVAGTAASANAADDTGMLAFNNHCRECHSYKEGDNRLGPSLYGVVGRKAGTEANFGNYSSSLKSSGIVWTPELLDRWIANPAAVVSDNNMAPPFGGVADASQRQAIIDFLKSDTNQPSGKPSSSTK